MRWTVREVARVLGVTPPPGLDPLARLAGVSIDSRSLRTGDLFFAIHGPRHDGHTFLPAVFAAGALAAVVSTARLPSLSQSLVSRFFPVPDPHAALKSLALATREAWGRSGPRRWLAAVTGSMGKTTTKEILAALISSRLRVLKSEGNLNNEFGAPLTLMRLEENHDSAVLELGMSRRGELARLAEITHPEIAVVTNVAPVHLEYFASLDEIALAKRELIEGLRGPDSIAVLNADDPRVARFSSAAPGRVLTFGFSPSADFRAESVEDRGALGSSFDLVSPTGRAHLELSLIGRHNLRNALAALAAASPWEITAADARDVLANLRPPALRGEVLHFELGFAIINDCYNSSPEALSAALELLPATPGFSRRIVVAGEMLELGAAAESLHRAAGEKAAAVRADFVFGVRGLAREILAGATTAGLPAERTRFFESSDEAAQFLAGFLRPGDLVLVKGSRGVKMGSIAEHLKSQFPLARPALDSAPSVRT